MAACIMQEHGARILIVILTGDFYCSVKFATDPLGMMTQCLKWKNVLRPPQGFHMNLLLKINTKMGGTNHTLASRLRMLSPQHPPPSNNRLPRCPGFSISLACS